MSFTADDVDVARDIGGRLFYDFWVSPVDASADFRYDITAARLGPLTAGLMGFTSEMKAGVGADDMTYSVCVPISDALGLKVSGLEAVADPATAIIAQTGHDVAIHGWGRSADPVFLLKFDPFVLESELGRMIGSEVAGPIRFGLDLDLRRGAGAQWWRVARIVASALRAPDSMVWNPIVAAPLASTLTASLLVATNHQYREHLDRPERPVRPPIVKRAIDIIEARPRDPLTVSEIAAEIGCSVRALQAGFAKHLGVSPSRYLAQVRMDRVHRELLVGVPGRTSVSQVAGSWGFSHLGRFAAAYRRTYGVTPSATLRAR